jgi:HAD superfamily hydrolase (TIGR01509 family)
MDKPKLILFDIGGVLIEYGNVFKTASTELGIPHALIDSTFDKYDAEITTGIITPQELYLNCLSNNKIDADHNYIFMLSWIKDYTSIKSTHDLLIELVAKYKVGLFSNIYKGMIPELIKQDLLPNINYTYQFISCDTGLQKPDINAYKAIMDTVNYPANELLFIDDKQENIDVANNLGWKTYLFTRENTTESVIELRKLLLWN